jgi:6-phosphogluconolactonase/glucosamine-6-phosphate isomerase/deaminase
MVDHLVEHWAENLAWRMAGSLVDRRVE